MNLCYKRQLLLVMTILSIQNVHAGFFGTIAAPFKGIGKSIQGILGKAPGTLQKPVSHVPLAPTKAIKLPTAKDHIAPPSVVKTPKSTSTSSNILPLTAGSINSKVSKLRDLWKDTSTWKKITGVSSVVGVIFAGKTILDATGSGFKQMCEQRASVLKLYNSQVASLQATADAAYNAYSTLRNPDSFQCEKISDFVFMSPYDVLN